MGTLTVSGNEITDATRVADVQGDGLTPPAGFGIWAAATNLCTNGGFESGVTGWTALSSTRTQDATHTKFGSEAMKIVTSNLAANEGALATFSGAASTQYSVSAWIYGASGTVRIGLFDSVSGLQASSPITLNGTFQRVTFTATTGALSAAFAVYVETNVQQSITFWVDGVQVETGAFSTPYIETNGSTASRSVAEVLAPSSLLNATQGWVALSLRMGFASAVNPNNSMAFGWALGEGGASDHRIQLFYLANTAWQTRRRNATSAGNNASVADSFNAGDARVVIVSWTATTIAISLAGAAFSSVSNSNVSTQLPATFEIGGDGANINPTEMIESNVLWCVSGTGTLTNTDATTLNGYGNTPPSSQAVASQLGAAAVPTMVWQAVTSTYNDYVTFTVGLTGAGSLSATVTPYQRISPSIAGAGTLSATVTPFQYITVSLTGVGTLTAALVPTKQITASITGFGTLTTTLVPYQRITATLAGRGTVTVIFYSEHTVSGGAITSFTPFGQQTSTESPSAGDVSSFAVAGGTVGPLR